VSNWRVEGLSYFMGKQGWLEKAKQNGLFQDLEDFVSGWLDKSVKNKLIIYFDELVHNPTVVINRIEAFWELPITGHTVVLAKERYTRGFGCLPKTLLRWLGLLSAVRKFRSRIEGLLHRKICS